MRRKENAIGWSLTGAAGFSLLALASAPAAAQPMRTPPPPPQMQGVAGIAVANGAAPPSAKSLKARIGLDAARALVTGDDPKGRARGVERLGAIGDPQGVDALLDALDPGTILSRDLDARLMAVRVLADHADRPEVRAYLARELTAAGAPPRATASLASVVRGAAAMALARQGDDKCLAALLVAVEQRGPASDAARAALLAYPPRTLDPLLFVPDGDAPDGSEAPPDEDTAALVPPFGRPRALGREPAEATAPHGEGPSSGPKRHGKKGRALSVRLIDLLGDLGDLRAIASLRLTEKLATAQAEARAHAALALAKLGDTTGAADARKWARSSDDKLVELGARTLILLDDWADEEPDGPKPAKAEVLPAKAPLGPAKGAAAEKVDPSKAIKTPVVRAVARLLSAPSARRAAMDLVADSRAPERFAPVLDQLETIAREPSGDDRSLALVTLARVGGAARVVKWLDHAALGHTAAYALATLPGDDATRALGDALEAAAARGPAASVRRLLRAGVVRATLLGVTTPGLDAAVKKLAASRDDADVEAWAFARVALGASVTDVLGDLSAPHEKTPSAAAIAGAARALLLSKSGAPADLAPLLRDAGDGESPSLAHVAAGLALLSPEGRTIVPQKTLLAWAEGGGALAPLAAYALPSRDDDAVHPRIKELLVEGTDPVIRAHVALGLSGDPDPSSTSLLVAAYGSDASPLVRRAAIRALSRRTEPQRIRALRWARDLDPDEGARTLAARALRGPIEETPLAPGLTISWTKVETTEGAPRAVSGRYLRSDGLALPLVSSADGEILEPAPAEGPASLSLFPNEGRAAAPPRR